jgi:hypothetical protein
MSGLEAPGALDRVALSSPQQLVLRAVALTGSLLLVAVAGIVGGTFSLLFTALSLVFAGLAVLLPESNAPLGLVLALGALWLRTMPDDLDAWTLVAAVDLAVVHVACTLASYGPAGLVLDRTLLARWGRRLALCVLAAVLTWAGSVTLTFLDLPPNRVVLAVALVALLGWAGFLAVRLASPESD